MECGGGSQREIHPIQWKDVGGVNLLPRSSWTRGPHSTKDGERLKHFLYKYYVGRVKKRGPHSRKDGERLKLFYINIMWEKSRKRGPHSTKDGE